LKANKTDEQNEKFGVSKVIVKRPDIALFKIIKRINSPEDPAKKESSYDYVTYVIREANGKDHQANKKNRGV